MMSRKLFSVILCLVLVLNFGFVSDTAQADDNEEYVIYPAFIYPSDGSVDIYVSVGDTTIIKTGWGACTHGLAQAWTTQDEISLSVNGEPVFSSPDEAQSYWGNVERYPINFECINGTDFGYRVYWMYSLGVLDAGTYTIHYEENVDHPFLDGGDFDGDGKPDISERHISVDFNIIVAELGSISGTVTEEGIGMPLEGMTVEACEYYDNEWDGPCFYANVEADGSYVIPNVLVGTYRVHTGWDGNWVEEYYPDTTKWDLAEPVDVWPGTDTPDINFTLEMGGSISGIVTEQDTGIPVVDMEVAACPYDFDSGEYLEGMPCYSGWTEVDGSYFIQGVPAGTYIVDSGWWGNWVPEIYFEQVDYGLADPVTVIAGENTSDIDFTLELGGSISGMVTEQDSGDPAIPVIDMEVAACPYDFDAGEYVEGMPCYSGWTEGDGSYLIRGVPSGTYIVDSGWWGNWVPEIYSEQVDYGLADPVIVVADVNTSGIDFTLERGSSISGKVTEQGTGAPIEGMVVDVCDYETGWDTCFHGWTEVDGTYFISGIPTGTYRLFSGWDDSNWMVEYYNEQAAWELATPVDVEANTELSGINFTLEMGGSISGHVSDANGDLVGVHVDVCAWDDSFCMGSETDENGDYIVYGLPEGDYRVSIWGGYGYWVDQFYDHVSGWDEATPVTVVAGLDTGDINFDLEIGGSISGWVTDTSGAPVVDMWVDACDESVSDEEWGESQLCNGASTNESGFYTIENLRPGNYRVVIWGGETYAYEFYDNTRSFYEAALVPVIATDTIEDINFSLSVPVPNLSAWAQDDYVEGWMWDEGSSVTLTIDDPSNGTGIDYSDTQTVSLADWNPEETYVSFNLQGEFDLQPGFSVMMTDANYEKQHIVTELTIMDVDPDLDIVSGVASPGSHVYVGTCDETGCINRHEVADLDGYWTADFSASGDEPGEENTFDIAPSTGGDAYQMDDDGDTTRVGWWIEAPYEPHPNFLVNLTPNKVLSWEWMTGTTVTLTIDAPGDEWTQIYSDTAIPTQEGSEPWETFTSFSFPAELGVGAGYRVTLTDGTTTKEHIVTYLVVLEANAAADTVSGMADPYAEIFVDSWLGANRRAEADATGFWSVNFSIPGTEDWEQDIVDLQPGDGGGINQYDEDGDSTNINWWAGGTISGTVYESESGDPLQTIAGVQVEACSTDDTYCNGTITNQSGEYTIPGLLPDKDYRVFILGQPGWVNEIYQETIWWHEATIVSPGATGIDFTLEPGGTISGIVTDGEGGPLVNIGVDIMDGGYGACTDENGYYSIQGLPFGTYDIIAGRNFCEPHHYVEQVIQGITIDVSNPDMYGVDFELAEGGLISGTVTAVGGGLIGENIDVSACFEDDSFCRWTSMQPDGSYVFTGLPAGDYRVHAYQYPEGYWIDEVYEETRDWDAYTPVTVTEGADTPNINFTLELGGAITGVVTDGEGNPLEGIWVSASKPDFFNWAMTDANGEYWIFALPSGDYDVFVSQQGDWVEQHYITAVSVIGGQNIYDTNFALKPGGSVSGTVTDEFGNHIPERIDVAACLVTAPDVCFWTIVQEDNTYTIIGLPAGEFYVNVYEVPEDGTPGGWIGYTYTTTVILGVDQDVTDINFMLTHE